MEHTTSRQNPLITRLCRLGAGKETRRAQGVFLCEGTKLVGKALCWGPPPELLTVVEGTTPPAELPVGVQTMEVPEVLLWAVSIVKTPQDVLTMCRTSDAVPPKMLPEGRLLALDRVQDPGNVGTVWCIASTFGVAGLFPLPDYVELFAPKIVCTAMGACFRLPVWERTLEDLTSLLIRLVAFLHATALRDNMEDVRSVPLGSAVMVIDSGERGVSQLVLNARRMTLKVPMRDRCESLDTAAAAPVVFWEGRRRIKPLQRTTPLRWDRTLVWYRAK